MKNRFYLVIPVCLFTLSLFFIAGCVSVYFVPLIEPLKETTIMGKGKDKILIIDISGVIYEKERSGLPNLTDEPTIVARIKEELTTAAKDKNIKAVILRINSPGGTVTASDVIYHEIKQFKKETGKKVISCIMDLGTSGAYYAAVSADKIVAHPTAVTGSIGVVMYNVSVEGLLQRIGIKDATIKTGEHKDMASPLRTMTDEERRIFQVILNEMHERFLSVILENRPELSREKLGSLADGRIYTAGQAFENKLIDKIGYLSDAISLAKKEAGLAEARIVMYHRPMRYKNNIYSQFGNPNLQTVNLFNIDLKTFVSPGTPSFMYLWAP